MSQKIDELLELKAQFQKQGQAVFQELFQDFFAKHPLALNVHWAQYTPYFNDGDECKFFRHEACLTLDLNKVEPALAAWLTTNRDDYEGDQANLKRLVSRPSYMTYPEGLRSELTPEETILLADFSGLIKSLWKRELSDLFKDLFGDHVRVTVTREGVETEEYEHD